MRVFLLEGEAINPYRLSEGEARYLKRVLHLPLHAEFVAKDKNEHYFRARIHDASTIILEETKDYEGLLLDGLSPFRGPFLKITMAISLLKSRRHEDVVRKLTEVGVPKIVLMTSELSEKALSDKEKERLSSIIHEAVQQSGGRRPELIGPLPFSKVIKIEAERKLIMHQGEEGSYFLRDALKGADAETSILALIGPESGFSEKEVREAKTHSFKHILLRTNILRAETASLYTAAQIQALIQ